MSALALVLGLASQPVLAQNVRLSRHWPLNPRLSLPAEILHSKVSTSYQFVTPEVMSGHWGYMRAEAGGVEDMSQSSFDSEPRKLSMLKAIGLSAVLPGAGQWYAGRRGQARLFFGIEAANWISYAGMRMFANWRRDDFVEYAVQHAGINPDGRDDEFFRLLNFYDDRGDYNAIGRAFDPDAPFIPDRPELQWNWDSPESRATYRQLRNDFQSAERNAEFMFVTAAINRLVSGIFAWQAVKRHNRRISPDIEDEFGIIRNKPGGFSTLRLNRPAPGQPASDGLMLSYQRSF